MKKSVASTCLCFLFRCTAFAASSRNELQALVQPFCGAGKPLVNETKEQEES